MKKPTIYLDTNIVSALHYDGTDINGLARRTATRDWWDSERQGFELIASVVTEQELAEGVYGTQRQCVRLVRRLKYVPITAEVRRLAAVFIAKELVPPNKPGDAAQLAMAVGHGLDYLLTWNYAHLANPATQARGEVIVARLGCRMPWLVSPESIPRASLGQTIRRPKT
jgi:hypothetical protein